jgi:hypothetical protein
VSNKPVGEVRPSQVITTFGPGAIVDLQTLSVVVAGVDDWYKGDDQRIQEPRLERNLGVECFYSAPPAEGDFGKKPGMLPSYLFPRYQVCSNAQCGTLSEPSEQSFRRHDKRAIFLCELCNGGGKTPVNPAPFIVACPSGHMDDFPWRRFTHGGPTNCKQPLQLKSMGKTGTVRDLRVICKCGNQRSVGDAFGVKKHEAVGACSGRRPWLGPHDVEVCQHADQAETLQRGATNSWFPLVRSALSIKDAATPIGKLLNEADPDILSLIKNIHDLEQYWDLLKMKVVGLEDYSDDRPAIVEYILKSRGDLETDATDLLLPEWEALRDPESFSLGEKSDFFSQTADVPEKLNDVLASVIQVRKLLEVRALTGFTRLESKGGPFGGDGEDVDPAPISRNPNLNWLPAVEVRGEGLFFEFRASTLDEWAKKPGVQARVRAMLIAFSSNKEDEEPAPPSDTDIREKSRFIVLHSFAHSVMRALALDCGYSGASIRERIYSSIEEGREMSGVLLYTASPDSEGSLGGLIDLGTPERLGGLLQDALRDITRCSSDPLCASHDPKRHQSMNGAACHACVLVPETSCEAFNAWLDRSLLVPTVATQDVSFFNPKHLGWE